MTVYQVVDIAIGIRHVRAMKRSGHQCTLAIGAVNMPLGKRTIDYIQGLRIAQGRHAGQPFEVLPWQARFLRGALAPGVGEASLTVGRGSGKSTLISSIGCAALDGPLMQPNAEVLIVASSHEQGEVIFRHVLRFLGPGIEAGAVPCCRHSEYLQDHKPGNWRDAGCEGERSKAVARGSACPPVIG